MSLLFLHHLCVLYTTLCIDCIIQIKILKKYVLRRRNNLLLILITSWGTFIFVQLYVEINIESLFGLHLKKNCSTPP